MEMFFDLEDWELEDKKEERINSYNMLILQSG